MALTINIFNPDTTEPSNLQDFKFNILKGGAVIDTATTDVNGTVTFSSVDPSDSELVLAMDMSYYHDFKNNAAKEIPAFTPSAPTTSPSYNAQQFAHNTPFGPNWVDNNTVNYYVTFFSMTAESSPGPRLSFTIFGYGCPQLTDLPLYDTSSIPASQTIGRNIYRAFSSDPDNWQLVGVIYDNTTTTFQDFMA